MREIKEASYTDYIFLFGMCRNAQTDGSVKRALEGGGKILILYEDAAAAGFLCYERFLEHYNVLYAYTVENKRDTGIFTELMQYFKDNKILPVICVMSVEAKSYGFVSAALKKLGFKCEESCEMYECDENGYAEWERYMHEKGHKLIEMLERQGFVCRLFSESSPELLDELYHSHENEFKNHLYPRQYFDNKYKNMNPDMSFIAEKDGHLAAYCLVRSFKSGYVIFEQNSAAEKYRGTGVIFLPYAKAMENLKRFNVKRAYYSIDSDNEHANAFRKKILDRITSHHNHSESYVCFE